MHRRHLLIRALLTPTLVATVPWSPAQGAGGFPSKTIKIVVPFPPGGPADALARILAARLGPALKQDVIVENRPGGATIIGGDAVAKAAPDGHTLLLAGAGGRTILPSVATMSYDPARDLVPVARLANSPNLFVVSPQLGVKTLKEFVALAKARPGKLNAGLPAPGTLPQMVQQVFARDAGIVLTEIPYRGGAAVANALMAGEVDFMTADVGAVQGLITAGKLVGLAIADDQRVPSLPHIPTTAEAGFLNLTGVNVWGVFTTAGTPAASVARLADAVAGVMKHREVQDMVTRQGMLVETSGPEAFENYLQVQTRRWAPVAKASGVRIN